MLAIVVYYNNQDGIKESHELDVTESTKISLTYQLTDYTKPNAVKNGYSKSISFQGTKNNNKIFGLLYNMNAGVLTYDPRQQIETDILVNGLLIDSGYICLDKITISNQQPTYSCTFYSILGQFFYNLEYKQDTETGETTSKTLADLYYGFCNPSNTKKYSKNEERTGEIIVWNSEYIYNSWNALNTVNDSWYLDNSKETGTPLHKYINITAAPCYNGIYEDFSSDTVLVPATTEINQHIPSGNTTYKNSGYYKVTMPRDLNEFEVRDLRSIHQRPAFRYKMLLDAMFDPVNNGGYNVNFMPKNNKTLDLVKSAYNNMFLIRDKITITEEDTKVGEIGVTSEIKTESHVITYNKYYGLNDYVNLYFNGSQSQPNWNQPSLDLDIYAEIKATPNYQDSGTVPENLFTCYKIINIVCFNIIAFKLRYKSISGGYKDKYVIAYTCPEGMENTYKGYLGTAAQMLREKYGAYIDNQQNELFICLGQADQQIKTPLKKAGTIDTFIFDSPIKFKNINDIDRTSPSISLYTKLYSFVHERGSNESYNPTKPEGNGSTQMRYSFDFASKLLYSDQGTGIYNGDITLKVLTGQNDYNSIYYDTVASSVQDAHITKDILFKNSGTPLSYLLAFTKMFNLKFVYNKLSKKIEIVKLNDFYDDNLPIVDLTKRIALDKSLEITHNYYKNNLLTYSFNEANTYLEYLYKTKTGQKYNVRYFDTGNKVVSGQSDLSSDLPFNTTGEYKYNSVYFTDYTCKPVCLKGSNATVEYTSYDGKTDGEIEICYNLTKKTKDAIHKLCMFDKENSQVSGEYLAFMSGILEFDKPTLYVSNNTTKMLSLHDSPCFFNFMYDTFPTSMKILNDTQIAAHYIKYMPVFMMNAYNIQFSSNDITVSSAGSRFKCSSSIDTTKTDDKEIMSFGFRSGDWAKSTNIGLYFKLPNIQSYGIGYPTTTIFDTIYSKVNNDIYDKDTFQLTCYIKLIPGDDINKLMRSFCYYNNNYFIINKITDYDPNAIGLYKVELIKVQSLDSYKNSEVLDTEYTKNPNEMGDD